MKCLTTLPLPFLFLSLVIVITGCEEEDKPVYKMDLPVYSESEMGMVSAGHPLATYAGAAIIEKGGNAADAAVASAFVLSVVEPTMSGLGGRLQAIVRTPEGQVYGVDASTEAPMTYDPDQAPDAAYGYPVIGIPGVVAGLGKLHEQFGSLKWSELLEPAINFAENGFYVLNGESWRLEIVEEQIREFESTSKYFLKKDGSLLKEGDLFVQKDLANTLRIIQKDGAKAFYSGKIAEIIEADMNKNGGYLNKEALASYVAKSSTVLKGNYRGFDVYSLWLPSFGAITIETLHILQNFELDQYDEGERANIMYQAMSLSYGDRVNQLQDGSMEKLISMKYADSLAQLISVDVANEAISMDFQANNNGHTTHLSTADASGLTVALTQSLGPILGSKVAAPGLGFVYASTMGSYLGPFAPTAGKRAVSHISPTIVTKGNQPFLALGCAGGSRIVTAVVQVISRVIDDQLRLDQAIAAPRVHPEEGILVENHEGIEWAPEDLEFLRSQGIEVNVVADIAKFGRINAVQRDTVSGKWMGASDPDWDGAAYGPQE